MLGKRWRWAPASEGFSVWNTHHVSVSGEQGAGECVCVCLDDVWTSCSVWISLSFSHCGLCVFSLPLRDFFKKTFCKVMSVFRRVIRIFSASLVCNAYRASWSWCCGLDQTQRIVADDFMVCWKWKENCRWRLKKMPILTSKTQEHVVDVRSLARSS